MTRIGIFMDALQGSIPPSFQERVAAYVRGLPNIAFYREEENLTSPESLSNMAMVVEQEKVDRVLILGGSPRLYETSFCKWKAPLPLNPYLFTVVNIREQILWLTKDEEEALERVKASIAKSICLSSLSRSIKTESLPLKPDVLVLGGGIVGISAALLLARSGIHVFLLEKSVHLGGKALGMRRLYGDSVDGQRWMAEKIAEVHKTPGITLLTRTELKGLDGHLGRFHARIVDLDGAESILSVSAIVVATGCATWNRTDGIHGHPRMISLEAMESILSGAKGSPLLCEGKPVETVTFTLDEVNEDIKIDSITAIRQSLSLQEDFHCQVAILCKDVKVSADGMERLYRKAREKGILFFKYETSPRFSMADGQIQVDFEDTALLRRAEQGSISILSDLVVCAQAFTPSSGAKALSDILGLHPGSQGFFMEDNPQLLRVRSNRKGIFVAGACRFPQELSESLIEARAAVQEVTALLSMGAYAYDLSVAEVDSEKCAVCYACTRLCPHSAITVDNYAERNVYAPPGKNGGMKWGAAKVDGAACYGCGICVAECPAKAILLHHLTDEQIYAQMGLAE